MKKVKTKYQKRKLNIFLIFLLFSSLAWFISKLSDDYTNRAVFDLEYINVPDSLLFVSASKQKIDVKLKASGFAFLGFNFEREIVKIDVAEALKDKEDYIVPKSIYQLQVEKQLSKSMDLLMIDGDDINLEIYPLFKKKIPVISGLRIQLAQNYMLDDDLKITPDSIVLTGPKKEVEQISFIKTELKKVKNISNNFSESLPLLKPKNLLNTKFSNSKVDVSVQVVRFSEKVLKVPVTVINLEEGYEIKIVPTTISVLCKGRIDDLKSLSNSDITVIADYNKISNKDQKVIPLFVKAKPKEINSVKLTEKSVTYILKRKGK
ncbi:hypothetical protein H0I23_08635 [Cellulophaga sp. HaHaR_3_176]|uniref:CdaR family protein n=1 Tax=Cellulophaga sp. HaHaR_3_176 TaxID=1942464 RepID=UPI001C1FD45E|nr:CdaR family protein [Cellulophaga sp. HaHaR_3_176]QWX82543.1 hypothetical protein H0I23_08635 [Cellulophaga sp. HaHaR_3_176]